eukprot:Blabericola_migrator_1__9597@NODE_5236_length_834_cov_3_614081_g3343_i0_p1_GENE_NODE_5236_length_834_cov_3_614081_g3343_i0NODE_5236_length_834_cov_3_614081_g3343_i0_p1_ORF_typecomplete_len198_score25_31Chromo/PF00385_24/2_2e06_NODE_5236_length_834_cov_3_614081_g3343_i035595
MSEESRQNLKVLSTTYKRIFVDMLWCLEHVDDRANDMRLRDTKGRLVEYLRLIDAVLEDKLVSVLPDISPCIVEIEDAKLPSGDEKKGVLIAPREKKHVRRPSDSAVADGVYTVERIDGVNMETKDFLVKWKGYRRRTWEPETTLIEADAEDLIRAEHSNCDGIIVTQGTNLLMFDFYHSVGCSGM